jgi:hypothetical protein
VGPLTDVAQEVRMRVRAGFWLTFLFITILLAWVGRYEVFADGMAYLDLANRVAAGNWNGLINGLWSPLYPLLIGILFRLFHVPTYQRVPVAHIVNVAAYVGAFIAFEFFLRQIVDERARSRERPSLILSPIWFAVVYTIFLWSFTRLHQPQSMTPDALMVVLLFIAGALFSRARAGETSWHVFALLGLSLGLGYLAKAVMFPMAFVFLLLLLFCSKGSRRAAGTLLAFVIFAAVSGPWIYALSATKGHFTFGDSGALNYAWWINGARHFDHWRGEPPGRGVAAHPTRRLFSDPEVFEFAEPIVGTFPPWTDPSYWNEGLTPYFDWKQLLHAAALNVSYYANLFLLIQGPVTIIVGTILLATPRASLRQAFKTSWPLLVAMAAIFSMYALVHVEDRYFLGAVVILWVVLIDAASPIPGISPHGLTSSAATAVLIVMGAGVAYTTVVNLSALANGAGQSGMRVARALPEFDIKEGDRVATLGTDIGWASLAQVRIVAEIPEPQADRFWMASQEQQSDVLQSIRDTGAKAMIIGPLAIPCHGNCVHAGPPLAGMVAIGETGFWILPLQQIASETPIRRMAPP